MLNFDLTKLIVSDINTQIMRTKITLGRTKRENSFRKPLMMNGNSSDYKILKLLVIIILLAFDQVKLVYYGVTVTYEILFR